MSKTTPKNILHDVMYSTIATVSDNGLPWAGPMFTVYDPSRHAIYWCAARNSQHGQNIQHNPNVFIVTYDSMAPGGQGEGVYLHCKASEVTEAQQRTDAYALLVAKHQAPYWSLDDLTSESSPIALFQAIIEEAWTNEDKEEDGHFVLFRAPVRLDELG